MTIGVDFDKTIYSYPHGWNGGLIDGPPVPGAIDGLGILMSVEPVFIFTARTDLQPVADWFAETGIITHVDRGRDDTGEFWNERGVLLITSWKYPARAYLDDLAFRFTDWGRALADLLPDAYAQTPDPVVSGRIVESLRNRADREARGHARTLAIVARYLTEHDAPGLRERLHDDGIDLPDVETVHDEWCLCATCRPDDEWGPPGRMVLN